MKFPLEIFVCISSFLPANQCQRLFLTSIILKKDLTKISIQKHQIYNECTKNYFKFWPN